MPRVLILIAAFLVCAAPAWAGHGGKLPFDGDITKKAAEAKMLGKPAAHVVVHINYSTNGADCTSLFSCFTR